MGSVVSLIDIVSRVVGHARHLEVIFRACRCGLESGPWGKERFLMNDLDG